MKIRLKTLHSLLIVSAISVFLAGCNIFGFTSDAEKAPNDKAEDLIREGKYQEARRILADAVKDSTDAMALYLNTKATMLESGVDLIKIAEFVENSENVNEGDNLQILAMIDDLSNAEKTAWYNANIDAVANLSKIFKGQIKSDFDPEDIALDYSVSSFMTGLLGIRDTNRDNVIDDNDFVINLDFINVDGNEGYGFDGGTFTNESGQEVEFSGLEVFLGSFALKSAKTSGAEGYKPDDINELISFAMSLFDNGSDGLKVLLGKNMNTLDPGKIDEYLTEIAKIINFYWYDDNIDNDGDGSVDEETIDGLDNDGDGLVDEDSNFYPGADTTPEPNTQYIPLWQKWNLR